MNKLLAVAKVAFIASLFLFCIILSGCTQAPRADLVDGRVAQNGRDVDALMNHMTMILIANKTVAKLPVLDMSQPTLSKAYEDDQYRFILIVRDQLVLGILTGECNQNGIADKNCTVSFAQPRLCQKLQANQSLGELSAEVCAYR